MYWSGPRYSGKDAIKLGRKNYRRKWKVRYKSLTCNNHVSVVLLRKVAGSMTDWDDLR